MTGPWAPEVADSPYASNDRSPKAQAWRRQAVSREARRRLAAGTYGAFSDDEMAHARAALGLDPRHDPVAEILGLEPATPMTEPAYSQLMLSPQQTQAIQQAFRGLAEAISVVMVDFTKAVQSAASSLAEFMEKASPATDPAALARRRHGRAALCPKHGPTHGGTCLRCS
jgi:hypothetical protein